MTSNLRFYYFIKLLFSDYYLYPVKSKILRLAFYLILIVGGWTLSYLRIPYVNHTKSFWVGFAFCICVFLITFLGVKIWGKNRRFLKKITTGSLATKNATVSREYMWIWIAVSVFIIVGALSSTGMIAWQAKLIHQQAENNNKRILELTEITESIRKSNQVNLMSNVLNQVEAEINLKPNGPLSDAIIARISALSFSLKPYKIFEGDSLSDRELSPERGQLLIALALMGIDSVSFAKIKQTATFAKADLRGVKLYSVDLNHINLEAADLSFSELTRVNLKHANLKKVWLKSSVVDSCVFNMSIITNSNMYKSIFRNCNFAKVTLPESNLTYTTFNECSFALSNLKFSDFSNSQFERLNFTNTNLEHANLSFCNLKNSDFRHSCLKFINLYKINISNIKLDSAEVQQNWFIDLLGFNISSAPALTNNFYIRHDTSALDIVKYTLFHKN